MATPGDHPFATSPEADELPLDARLLSEAIIELNISRRSVGLYPPGHIIITSAIDRAYGLLTQLLKTRPSITLGIARDSLVIDDTQLDRYNPVYRECALKFFHQGLMGITFTAGLNRDELVGLHELLVSESAPVGKAFIDAAAGRGITHIILSPIDYEHFQFVEGVLRASDSQGTVWDHYVQGLMDGRLTTEQIAAGLPNVPVERMAELLAEKSDAPEAGQAYDRVIAAYLTDKSDARQEREALSKLTGLVNSLPSSIRHQFNERAGGQFASHHSHLEKVLEDLPDREFEQIASGLLEQGETIPATLKNLIDRLSLIHHDKTFAFEMLQSDGAVFHDIAVPDRVTGLFTDDHFSRYVSPDYQRELEAMLRHAPRETAMRAVAEQDCSDESVDRVTMEIMIEALEMDETSAEDYLQILSRLCEQAALFVDTGRFEDALMIYNIACGHGLTGRYQQMARTAVQHYFHSEAFVSRLIDNVLLWGRSNREGLIRLARVMKTVLMTPLLDALCAEPRTAVRKLLLQVLTGFGQDIIPPARRLLKDERWYVTRNMLFLIRACGSPTLADEVNPYARNKNPRIAIEAMKCLLHFRTRTSIPMLRVHLRSNDRDMRDLAIKAAGTEKVAEVVSDLLKVLEEKTAFLASENWAVKHTVVRALGQIGHPDALPSLERILGRRAFFEKAELLGLKTAILKSLRFYPEDLAQPLVSRYAGKSGLPEASVLWRESGRKDRRP